MSERLRVEIHNKSLEIKNKIKELNNILSNLYNEQRRKQSNNIHFIKRTADKVNSAARHISNVDMKPEITAEGRLEKQALSDVEKLHKTTLANILILEEFYKDKLRKEQRESKSQETMKLRRNLDSLRLAYEDLKRLDTNMNLKSREWREIDLDT